MIEANFQSYPPDITEQVINALSPRIEAEIKRVHEAAEAARAVAIKMAITQLGLTANDASLVATAPEPQSEPDPTPPTKPTKRRSAWTGLTKTQRSEVVRQRWEVRRANNAKVCGPVVDVLAADAVRPAVIGLTDLTSDRPIRYASVCSGVEGLSLAWEPLGGFEPVFFSEIEPFPSAVLAKRWPEVPNLGDLTKIDGREWKGKVDALWSSLPCQAFSMMGNRQGAKDERGAMFRPFLTLADDIDPTVIIMENVVGLRSDPVFREILNGLSGSDVAGRISKSGTHDGPVRRLAWTVLDSGTEQRRLRLFLVACSQSSGIDPSAILPQPEAFAPDCGKAQKAAVASSQGSVIWLNADVTPKWSQTRVGTLRAAGGSGGQSLVCVDGRVRELMPEERERLMGWDGNHTEIEWKGTERTLDRARNKTIGNSLALPPVRAIGEKLKAALAAAGFANDNGPAVSTALEKPVQGSVPAPHCLASVSQNSKIVDLRIGDCLAEMATLPASSVDLIAADLPYGTTACPWDKHIDLDAFWTEVRRVLTPTGTVILTSAGRFTANLIVSNLDWYRYPLVWVKTRMGQFLHAKYRPLSCHEDVLIFSPARATLRAKEKMTYNPQGLVDLPVERIFEKAAVAGGVYKSITTTAVKRVQKQTNYPGSILNFPSEGSNQHPTQKPVALMEYLIATYSNEGDCVLDPTMGSGTAGVAAIGLGRRFIGIEKEQKYYDIAHERIGLSNARDKCQRAGGSLPKPKMLHRAAGYSTKIEGFRA